MLINGDFQLSTEITTVLETGKDYSASLSSIFSNSIDTDFKGFMIRIEPLGSQSIGNTLTTTFGLAKDLDICPENVNGITHTSRSLKSSVPFSLYFEEGGDYLLEVTVVRSRTFTRSNDWYYSKYNISVETVTNSPTISIAPSATPTPRPSVAPSASPTSTPSQRPVDSTPQPTSPTNNPTASPTSGTVSTHYDYRFGVLLVISSIICAMY